MQIALIEGVILLVSLVVLSNIISHYWVAVPISLIQITVGLILALFFAVKIPLESDWFTLLFIAPLLYNDGATFPKRQLWELKGPIITNAILLVFVATFVGGLFFHWLLPTVPLAAAFAFAAIMSPTDPIAVESIARRAKLPNYILHLVAGESLINDASGLIGFKYGVNATVSGVFNPTAAILDFFYISIVGALVGIVLALVFHALQAWLLNQGISDVLLHTILSLIVPFVVYLLSEEVFHASGVIAVVLAGIMASQRSVNFAAIPELRIVTKRTWQLVVYILNGLVFLILGIELPVAFGQTITDPGINTFKAVGYVGAFWLMLVLIRMGWTYGAALLYYWRTPNAQRPSVRTALLSGLSGVRGAISMAAVLSLPLTIEGGAPFPERSLLLFVAAGTVILSLVMAAVFLPLLSPGSGAFRSRGSSVNATEEEDDDTATAAEQSGGLLTNDQAQSYALRVAITALEGERHEENQQAVLNLIDEYERQLRQVGTNGDRRVSPTLAEDLRLRIISVQQERIALDRLWRENLIQATTYTQNVHRLRTQEADYAAMLDNRFHPWVASGRRLLARIKAILTRVSASNTRELDHPFYNEQLFVDRELAKGAIKGISKMSKTHAFQAADISPQTIYRVITRYRARIAHLKSLSSPRNDQYATQLKTLRQTALAAERSAVQEMFEAGRISPEMAAKMRQQINFAETLVLSSGDEPV
ncbi:cation:proton antiporter [Schleiferilactobacillus perolens]|jgi:CPA1 family monovalent cation:H+ antiporter|uniref:NhaP-type Na H and K H antiporter n=1 Tax=Schleiferilactobacillus perolens DSM 12744 TaxID=1423792 RepID=A0A0R1N6L8_9LACO|nr:sodium:proton antiporter [Schleiferilactobacillus perolens]KRL13493.1 NhaP-type Na H and K H antiporter [Schleiferilactobacillus perolens DSM 12744]MCI1891327.1 sodium:proton antiporter [Schleiferilactobacillus harbinensis]MCI1913933.1 sodium:proton antiporter [Schleiferilactobacillus harbinensis]MCI2170188.1 sodium:proton antiporter [Schleiferilactobacillus perolens]